MSRKRPAPDGRHRRHPHEGDGGARTGDVRPYAVLDETSHPIRCYPGLPENAGHVRRVSDRHDGRTCFRDEAAAKAAAVRLHRPPRVYRCPRIGGSGPTGHWHHDD